MKKALLLIVLLIVVIAVSARLPRKPGKPVPKKPNACTANCKLCQGRSCFVCEHGHALYKGYHQRGKGVCVKKCPTGYKAKVNPAGGNECVRDCTANCKTCQGSFCSVCEQGHALYKGFGGFGKGRCLRKCPKGYKAVVNPSGGNKCVRSCVVANCESCPRSWTYQPKCARCESGFYRLSIGKSWTQHDFCLSNCPTGYVPKNVKGVAQCQKEPETEHSTTYAPATTTEEYMTIICNFSPYATTEAEPTTVPSSSTTSPVRATLEAITEPEPSPIVIGF